MAQEKISLTKSAIQNLPVPPKGKRAYYVESKTRALYLDVTGAGTKSFYVYRKVGGKPERIFIGRFPEATVEMARKRAGTINSEIDGGANPNAIRRDKRAEFTLDDLYDEYIDRHAKAHNKRPENAEYNYKQYIKAKWGNRRLSDISQGDLQAWHVKLGKTKGHVTANIAIKLLSAMFNKAKQWGLFKGENPTLGVQKFREKSRERFLLPEEFPRFMKALGIEENETFRDFILVCLFTGARRGNVQAMRWDQVEWEMSLWRIPETKNGTSHSVPLVPYALALLRHREERLKEAAKAKDRELSDFVFPGTGDSGHLEEPKRAWAALLKRADIKDLRIHDLRRTLGSWLAMTGANLPVIGKTLNHKTLDAVAVYARLNDDPVRYSIAKATTAMFAAAGPQSDLSGLPLLGEEVANG